MLFLNAGGALLLLPFLILFMLIAILLESWIMHLLRYRLFKKSLLPVSIANLVSLFGGFGLIEVLGRIINAGQSTELLGLLILFATTLILEGIVIYAFNRNKPFKQTAWVILLMNISTYIIYYLIFLMMLR